MQQVACAADARISIRFLLYGLLWRCAPQEAKAKGETMLTEVRSESGALLFYFDAEKDKIEIKPKGRPVETVYLKQYRRPPPKQLETECHRAP